jgi:hypothetical protein
LYCILLAHIPAFCVCAHQANDFRKTLDLYAVPEGDEMAHELSFMNDSFGLGNTFSLDAQPLGRLSDILPKPACSEKTNDSDGENSLLYLSPPAPGAGDLESDPLSRPIQVTGSSISAAPRSARQSPPGNKALMPPALDTSVRGPVLLSSSPTAAFSMSLLGSPFGRIRGLDDSLGLLSPMRASELEKVLDGMLGPDAVNLDSFPLYPADTSFGLGL